jgi:hypothetical protein
MMNKLFIINTSAHRSVYIEFRRSITFQPVFIWGRDGQGWEAWLVTLRCHGKGPCLGESVKWPSSENRGSQAAVDTPEATSETMKEHESPPLQSRRT